MADNLTKEQRSKNMSRIRSKNTKPELIFRKKLHSLGYRYSLHKKDLPGKPDLYLKKYNLAIFIHGCFWHRHQGCSRCSTPSQNKEYWSAKFKKNVDHDKSVYKELRRQNMNYLIFWECEIKQRTMMILEDKIVREIEKCREKLR